MKSDAPRISAAERLRQTADRLLSRATRNNTTPLLLLIFLGVGLVATFVIRDIQSANADVNEIYTRSVHGLQRIGKLQYDAQETRRATLYALSTSDSNLQVEYADQSRAADQQVKDEIEEYSQEARRPPERLLADRLRRDWDAYLGIRDEVLASILEGSTKEAVDFDLSRGVSAFDLVRRDLNDVMALYDHEASQRLSNVVASSRRSSLRLVEILGFTLLLSVAAVWAIQRGRVLSTLELARLQIEFVASVSHELRTPLSVLRSASDNIADGLVTDPAGLRKYGLVLQNQSRRMSQLVDQILLFASTEDRQHQYVLQPIPVAEILTAVLNGADPLLHQVGFRLDLQIEADLPPVMAQLSGVCQCLQNLIGNAIKYSRDQRTIVLRATAAPHSGDAASGIGISVIDHGLGISHADLSHIFEPFYRSPQVVAAQIHGTGLGLALAKRIAEAMGGRLTVVSELSVGSTFTLHLPVATEEDLQRSATLSETSASGAS